MSRIKKLICLVMAFIFTFTLVGCNDNKTKKEEKTEEEVTAVSLNLSEFYSDIVKNKLAAEEEYLGNRYFLTAEITSIYDGEIYCFNYEYVPELDRNVRIEFKLYYKHNQRDYVLGLSAGDTIKFEGTLISLSETLNKEFEDVVFIDE